MYNYRNNSESNSSTKRNGKSNKSSNDSSVLAKEDLSGTTSNEVLDKDSSKNGELGCPEIKDDNESEHEFLSRYSSVVLIVTKANTTPKYSNCECVTFADFPLFFFSMKEPSIPNNMCVIFSTDNQDISSFFSYNSRIVSMRFDFIEPVHPDLFDTFVVTPEESANDSLDNVFRRELLKESDINEEGEHDSI